MIRRFLQDDEFFYAQHDSLNVFIYSQCPIFLNSNCLQKFNIAETKSPQKMWTGAGCVVLVTNLQLCSSLPTLPRSFFERSRLFRKGFFSSSSSLSLTLSRGPFVGVVTAWKWHHCSSKLILRSWDCTEWEDVRSRSDKCRNNLSWRNVLMG